MGNEFAGVYTRPRSPHWWIKWRHPVTRKIVRESSEVPHDGGTKGRRKAAAVRRRRLTDAEQGKAVQKGTELFRVGQWDSTTDTATGLCKLFADDLANNGRPSGNAACQEGRIPPSRAGVPRDQRQ
jgi:hypothetical protein